MTPTEMTPTIDVPAFVPIPRERRRPDLIHCRSPRKSWTASKSSRSTPRRANVARSARPDPSSAARLAMSCASDLVMNRSGSLISARFDDGGVLFDPLLRYGAIGREFLREGEAVAERRVLYVGAGNGFGASGKQHGGEKH